MTEPDQREKEIFNDAFELVSAEAREAYLQEACAGDPELRHRIDALLKASAVADGFLPRRTVAEAETVLTSPVTEGPGSVIGRYKLLEQIGEGGFGVVYMAEQQEPVRRQVALKIIKLGMDTRQVIARFEAERQALALMDHPNIARVFDAGATETGRPYFVMELVQGIPITRFCDENRLSTCERLDLFVQVCRAIHHAHQKAIIHRDIKPSNILVTVTDPASAGVPKVIDFGIAKATEGRLMGATVHTQLHQFMGTPVYMSPEQAVMGPGGTRHIDTRSDIYSLGALLYELLTGSPPFDANQLLAAGLEEMQRIIRGQEPVRPSTRLTRKLAAVSREEDGGTAHAGSGLTTSRGCRQIQELIPVLRRDLDWIVMKCLEKDRTRRYETAHALAEDIQRHLRHEPVLAAPPSLAYRTRKFWQRHRSRITTAAVVMVLLLGLVTTAWMYRRSVRAQRVRWAREVAVPELVRLIEQQDYRVAFPLAQRAKAYIPRDAVLTGLWPRIAQDYSITTTPGGAAVYCREYTATNAPWQYVGQSPVAQITLPHGPYRWKIEKEGCQVHECVADDSFEVRLQAAGPAAEMVWVEAFTNEVPATSNAPRRTVEVPAYLLDKYEVTNEKYQAFVDAGGYEAPEFWQGLAFVEGGRQISLSEALRKFVDRTGRPGPAAWANGAYPVGHAQHPVSGISWFEATAYARFAGKDLPTVHHWKRAACLGEFQRIVPFSNFGTGGTTAVGVHPGMGDTGLYDMAGNVKEWCFNAGDDSAENRYLLGGGWGDPTYMFLVQDSRSSWNRSPQNGFRCARFPQGMASVPRELFTPVQPAPWRDLSGLIPFSDEEFRSLKAQYEYDQTPLNAKVESVDDRLPWWRAEKVTFDAAYGGERVIAHLFLPKTRKPHQGVVYFPGMYAVYEKSFGGLPLSNLTEHLLTNGRALLVPIYYGTYERPATRGRVWTTSSVMETPLAYRDWTVRMAQDLSRCIDYLETRDDIDAGRVAYFGFSWGAQLGPIMLAVEDRLDAGVLVGGGIPSVALPRSLDIALYAQRVRVPVLMINGSDDVLAPLRTSQIPMYERLGTPSGLKHHQLYPGGHEVVGLFYREVRRDTLAWLDRYLGPVK